MTSSSTSTPTFSIAASQSVSETSSASSSTTLANTNLAGEIDQNSEQSSSTTALIGSALGGSIFLLLVFYIGYKRRQNKKKHGDEVTSLSQQYAIQLGLKDLAPGVEMTQRDSCKVNGHENGCQIGSKNPLAKANVLTTITREGGHEQVSTAYSIQASSSSLPFELVEIKGMESSERSTIKVVSSRQPHIRSIQSRGTEETKSPMRIAVVSDIDTSTLGSIDRTIIKLRQWKAKLLNEPPPVVEISVSGRELSHTAGESEAAKKQRQVQGSLATSLRFAPKGKRITNRPFKAKSLIMSIADAVTSFVQQPERRSSLPCLEDILLERTFMNPTNDD